MYKYAPGFVSKNDVQNTPFIGFIADKIETLWLDRSCKNSRSQISEALKKRQQEFINKEVLTPLMVFPEGTTTTGAHILKFKKGAFDSLQSTKSIIFKSSPNFVGEGIMPTELQLVMDFSRLYNVFTFYELPNFIPTEKMYENYKKLNPQSNITDKAEIYAEVVRDIWVEIGNYKKSDMGFRDYTIYANLVKNKKNVSFS